MNTITLSSDTMPVLAGCNFCVANESFLHADRILDFHVMLYVVSGCIYVTEEDTDYEVHAGEVFFLKSGIRHYGKKEIQKGTSWYYAHFYLDEPAGLYSSMKDGIAMKSVDTLRFQMTLPKTAAGLEQSKIADRIADLVDSLRGRRNLLAPLGSMSDDPAAYPWSLWNANAKLFSVLTEIAAGNLPALPQHSLSDRIAEYLSLHTSEKFCAEALEKHFFLSYKYMAAVFKKETSMTLHQYHTRTRMTAACQLLCTTMKTIGEISEALGYHDMLYFSRCFHQTMGMSPTEYRRQQTLNY